MMRVCLLRLILRHMQTHTYGLSGAKEEELNGRPWATTLVLFDTLLGFTVKKKMFDSWGHLFLFYSFLSFLCDDLSLLFFAMETTKNETQHVERILGTNPYVGERCLDR